MRAEKTQIVVRISAGGPLGVRRKTVTILLITSFGGIISFITLLGMYRSDPIYAPAYIVALVIVLLGCLLGIISEARRSADKDLKERLTYDIKQQAGATVEVDTVRKVVDLTDPGKVWTLDELNKEFGLDD